MNRNNEKTVRTLPFFLCGIFLVVICGLYDAVSALNAAAQFEDNPLFVLYELLFPAFVITMLFTTLLWNRKGDRMYRAYAFSVMVSGALYLAVMPGLSTPDELSHYSAAYRISSNMMFEGPLIRPAGFTAVRTVDYPLEDMNGAKTPLVPGNEESVSGVLGNPVKQITYRAVKNQDKRCASSTKPVASAIPGVHATPAFYLPQAVDFSIMRALGLGTMGLLFLGRFLNLCCYVALTALAVRTTPFGKGWSAAAGLLPMSVSLAASLSYDASLIGIVFLFITLIFKLAYGAEEIRTRELFALYALVALFGPCKLVYAPLILLFQLVPARVFGGGGKELLYFLILLLSLIAAVLMVNADVLEAYFFPAVAAQTDNVSADLHHADSTAAELFSHPLFALRMLLSSFPACIPTWGGEMIETKLSNLDPLLGVFGLQTLFFALGLFCLTATGSTGETVRILVPGTRAARRAAHEREENERAATGTEALPETGTGAVAAEITQAENNTQAEMETTLNAVPQQATAGEVLTTPLDEHVAETAEALREAETAVAAQAAASEAMSAAGEAGENVLSHYIEVGIPGRVTRLSAFLVGALSSFGVLGAMLLAWTSRGTIQIEGVQSRYFLSLLPVFLFSLQSRMLQSRLPFRRLVPYGFVMLDLCVGIRILALTILRV